MFLISRLYLKQALQIINKPVFINLPFRASAFSFATNNKPIETTTDSFKDRDKLELMNYEFEKDLNWKYKKIRDGWKKPLEKKRLRRERLAKIEKPVSVPESQKVVIHNPLVGIEMPTKENEIFAVLEIAGFQYKVVKDDQVLCEYLKEYDINDHIVFEKVLLVGTKDYTSVGRPFVETCKVYATVEEQCLSEKVIVFKKRRRKHYKRTAGAKQKLTVIRIDKIEHILDENVLNKAVALGGN